jgi:hypothetical protein
MALKFGVEHELRIEEDRIVLQEILPTE